MRRRRKLPGWREFLAGLDEAQRAEVGAILGELEMPETPKNVKGQAVLIHLLADPRSRELLSRLASVAYRPPPPEPRAAVIPEPPTTTSPPPQQVPVVTPNVFDEEPDDWPHTREMFELQNLPLIWFEHRRF